jgi:hypothetical protein
VVVFIDRPVTLSQDASELRRLAIELEQLALGTAPRVGW